MHTNIYCRLQHILSPFLERKWLDNRVRGFPLCLRTNTHVQHTQTLPNVICIPAPDTKPPSNFLYVLRAGANQRKRKQAILTAGQINRFTPVHIKHWFDGFTRPNKNIISH